MGGFATVWLYHDAELRSDVAVKALAENWSQRLDVRERFLEEARILRQADSDHIVRVYDIGEVDGTPYFVMTYADLGSLAKLVDPGEPLPPARVGGPDHPGRAPASRSCTTRASSTATSSRRTSCSAAAAPSASASWSRTSASRRRCCTRPG